MPARIERNYDNVSRMMGAFEAGAASNHGAAGGGVDRGAIDNLLNTRTPTGEMLGAARAAAVQASGGVLVPDSAQQKGLRRRRPADPVVGEAPAPESHGMAICEKSDCGRQFRSGPISLARREAGQPLVCRSCDAVAQMPQDGPIEAAAAEPVPEPEPGSPPEYAPQTDGHTTWCRRHSLVSIGPQCVDCLKGTPPLETSRGGMGWI